MATGACGINCDACRLNLREICSSCGPGTSQLGAEKSAAQTRILGASCPILACAVQRRIEYCARDCDEFPCSRFRQGPYPFSAGFLQMQERRRREPTPVRAPSGSTVQVPLEYWEELSVRDLQEICSRPDVRGLPPMGVLLPFLREYLLVDMGTRKVYRQSHGQWEPTDNELLELLCLVYLLHSEAEPLSQQLVSARELRTAHFFTGPHELKVKPVLRRYGTDTEGFIRASEKIGGEPLDMADAAFRFMAFPMVPVYYLLWRGDEEFEARLSILFDRSIERRLAPDAIWGLVNLISDMLVA